MSFADIEKIKALFNEQEADIKKMEETTKKLEIQVSELNAKLDEKIAEIHHYEKEMKMVRIEYTKQVHENEETVRRYRKIIEDEKIFSITKFAKDLLEVRDNLRFGMDTFDDEQTEKE